MKPVIIKNIEIGKGLPKIAVPLVAANTQELEQALRVLKETAFDIIEFRADFFQEALDADFIAEQLGIVRQAFPDKPLLFTFRRAQEGGNTPCSDDYYFELLEWMIKLVDNRSCWYDYTFEEQNKIEKLVLLVDR